MHKLQSGHWRVVDAPDDWDEETDGYPDHQSAKIFGTEAEAWAEYMNRAKPEDQTGVDVAG